MKKIMKAILSLALLLVMAAGQSTYARAGAVTDTGADEANAGKAVASASFTYKGQESGMEFRPGSKYSDDDMFNFKNVMPGDELTEEITFTNAATDCGFINLYMRAELPEEDKEARIDSAQAEASVLQKEFLEQLAMTVTNKETGERIFEGQASQFADGDRLGTEKLLGTFRHGDTATLVVTLKVPLEMDNTFASCLGKVDWIFHVEAYQESQLCVRKVWSDGNNSHANEKVAVNLLKNGAVERSAELSAANGWAYTFDRLVEGNTWTVEEASVPSGYTVSYRSTGNEVVITNTKKEEPHNPGGTPEEPATPTTTTTARKTVEVTAKKVWGSELLTTHPDAVVASLYNGEALYAQVYLNADNNWTYTWKNLDATGNWLVMEACIPYGYVPSYAWDGKVMTITNTRVQTAPTPENVVKLIQTGQLNWPVWVLGGAGIVLLAAGVVLVRRRSDRGAGR